MLVLTDIYAAGEQPIEGATAEALAKEIRSHGQKDVTYIADRESIPEHLAGIVKAGDIVITLGRRQHLAAGRRRWSSGWRDDLNLTDISIRGQLLYNEPMSRHTSLRVGGRPTCSPSRRTRTIC